MSRENKTFQFTVSTKGVTTNDAGQEFGQIECYAAVFNVIDDGNDRILPGAFKRTIKNSKERASSRKKKYLIPILWQHDPNEMIGGWHTLSEDVFGLKCSGDINLSTQRGREYWELARAEMSDSFSIVYDVPQGGAKYDKAGIRELSELRLFSCDPVTFPMCDETLLVGVKAKKNMTTKPKEKKDFNTLFQAACAADALEDWGDLVNTLTQTMIQAFSMGDSPQADMKDALEQFSAAVMTWCDTAVQCSMDDYLSDQGYSSSSAPYVPYSLRMGAGYMSRQSPLQGKAGRAISSANADKIQGHIDNLNDLAEKAMKSMKAHTSAVRSVADDLATVLQGSEAAYGTDQGEPEDNEQEGKSATSFDRTRRTQTHSSKDTASEDELSNALKSLQLLRT